MSDSPPGSDRRDPNRPDRRKHPALSGHLELLSKMSGYLAVTLDIEETIRKALELIIRYVHAEAGSLFLLEKDASVLHCKASVGPVDIKGLELQVTDGIVGQCVSENRSRIVRDVSEDPGFAKSVDEDTGFRTRSILCVPLNVQEMRIGAIELINKRDTDGLFSDADLLMLQALAGAAALAIRNARITEKLVAQERVNREIELAIQMQRSLLPDPREGTFPLCGVNVPAYEVSGDFYDFFELEDGRIYFSIGDVSGKGMDAALLMSKTASLFHCLGKSLHDPSVLLVTINNELRETAINGMFVTMVCGLYDPAQGNVRLANAGHEPPLLHDRDGNFRAFPASAPPLGIIILESGADGIAEETITLGGGTLYLFTDGVTEGVQENGNRLEVGGLKAILESHRDRPAVERIHAVVSRLRHTGRQQHDDITLLAVDDLARPQHAATTGGAVETLLRLTFLARPDELHRVREAVRKTCERTGCSGTMTQDLVIAVGEACQNIVRHAYRNISDGEATLEILRKEGILEFRLHDSAPPVDREKVRPVWPESLQPGGLGVCLIHDIMDRVEYLEEPSGRGNLLRMVKYLQ